MKEETLTRVSGVKEKQDSHADENKIAAFLGVGCLWFFSAVAAAAYLPNIVPAEWQGPVRCLTILAVLAPFVAPTVLTDGN